MRLEEEKTQVSQSITNLGGVKSLVAKGIDLGWVFAYPSFVAWPSFCALVAKLVKK